MTPTPYLLPVELIYRALARPKPREPKPAASVEAPPAIELTRTDVDQIIHRKRAATPEELQKIIEQFKLTDGERNQLCCDLTIAMSQRARQVNGRREDPNSRFIHDLGYAQTPFGLLPERAWFQTELQTATQAIAACRRHLTPQCACWRQARENLYSIRESFGERSPESWAALRVWEALEEIEISSRPDSGSRIA
jgi:hypothetical protein